MKLCTHVSLEWIFVWTLLTNLFELSHSYCKFIVLNIYDATQVYIMSNSLNPFRLTIFFLISLLTRTLIASFVSRRNEIRSISKSIVSIERAASSPSRSSSTSYNNNLVMMPVSTIPVISIFISQKNYLNPYAFHIFLDWCPEGCLSCTRIPISRLG